MNVNDKVIDAIRVTEAEIELQERILQTCANNIWLSKKS